MPFNSSTNANDSTSGSNLLSGLVGLGGALYGQSVANSGANKATSMAQLPGASISTPGGTLQATNVNGQLGYNVNSPLAPQFSQFANIAGAAGNNALNGIRQANPLLAVPGQTQAAYNAGDANLAATGAQQTAAGGNYLNAGNGVLSQFQNFNPQAYAQQQYNNLAALAAPGQTDQTQAMLNYEQASGRGGLTQNGQLGDLGGLALSQNLADQNRQLQAQGLADQRMQNLGALASGLSNTGSNFLSQGQNAATNRFGLAANALNNAQGYNANNLQQSLAASGGANSINQQLLALLQTSIGAQGAEANAGANAGKYQYLSGQNQANTYGNLFGGLMQGSQNGGGLASPNNLVNLGKNAYNYFAGSGAAGDLGISASDQVAALGGYGGDVAPLSEEALGLGGDATDLGSLAGSFSSAGGQAANAGLSAIGTGAVDDAANAGLAEAGSSLADSGGAAAGVGAGALAGGLGLALMGYQDFSAPDMNEVASSPLLASGLLQKGQAHLTGAPGSTAGLTGLGSWVFGAGGGMSPTVDVYNGQIAGFNDQQELMADQLLKSAGAGAAQAYLNSILANGGGRVGGFALNG